MSGHMTSLRTERGRERAHMLVAKAPPDWICEVRPITRTKDQNSKLWAMLSDISVAMPEGRKMTPEQWKCVFMQACGYEVQFLNGLDGQPFPAGFRSSKMSKSQMIELIEFVQAYAAQQGIRLTDPGGAA